MHLAIILVALLSRSSFDFQVAVEDPRVLTLFEELAVNGGRQAGALEVAAFIVRDDAGEVGCLLWPFSGLVQSARYHGRIPSGTIALAHTHPARFPEPSPGDIVESRRLGLPIYVLSRRDVYVVDPSSGESLRLIRDANWALRNEGRCARSRTWVTQATRR